MKSFLVGHFVLMCFFGVIGMLAGAALTAKTTHATTPNAFYSPLPHHVPPTPNGVSLRFAMVHDIIHERYPKHGSAYYQERERLARLELSKLQPEQRAALDLMDDIGAGLHRMGKTPEAIALLQRKLEIQRTLKLPGNERLPESEMYTTYANLGTFLVEANAWAMLQGDATARAKVEQGRDYIAQSMQANPNAHFGRESWQRKLYDFYLDVHKNPAILRDRDFIGNPFNDDFVKHLQSTRNLHAKPYDKGFTMWVHYAPKQGNRIRLDTMLVEGTSRRRNITKVGVHKDGEATIPFDEPVLGIIGMWRQGSGPNPHFAVCLAETMLRVGQRFIAWSCYERASRLAAQFSPDPQQRDFLKSHCVSMQQALENTMTKDDVVKLRPQFERELAFGENYQREFQRYTAQKLQAGTPLDANGFYEEFNRAHPAIASRPGSEEWYASQASDPILHMIDNPREKLAGALLGGGLAAFMYGLCVYVVLRRPPTETVRRTPNKPSAT